MIAIKRFFSGVKSKLVSIARYDTHGYKNKRKYILAIASMIVIIGVVVVFASSVMKARSLTGYVVQQEQQLVDLKTQLDNFTTGIEAKEQEVTVKQEELAAREQELSDVQQQLADKNSIISNLEDEISDKEDDLDDLDDEVTDLRNSREELVDAVESAAWSLCCSLKDFKDGAEKDWEIDDGVIECSGGQYTVDCESGDTTFED